MLKTIRVALLAVFAAAPLAAADLALVIGNEDYDSVPDIRRGDEVVDAGEALRDAGVEVIEVRNGTLEEMLNAVKRFAQSAPKADQLLVVLSGRFLSTAADAYLLPVETAMPSLATLPAQSLPVSVALAVLAEAPGRSVLVLATEPGDGDGGEAYVRPGHGSTSAPQGVTLVTAEPRPARDLIEDVLAIPGVALARGIAGIDGAEVSGFVPADYAFLPAARPQVPAGDGEAAAWDAALERDTVAAYEDYLAAYPAGRNAREARRRADALRADPLAQAEAAEADLSLGREARRQVQRDLALLGYDTRGIDGIFGPGTRGAVRDWQQDEGLEATGYLDAGQIDQLARAAVARAEVLEREAAQRRAERTAADRAFWAETGAAETETGYRRYLENHPDGVYAEVAQERLAAIQAQRQAEANAAERAAWQEAQQASTLDGYRTYLANYPEGAFAAEARAALEQGSATESAESQAAAAAERALGLNPLSARLVEERLKALGLDPGAVDGTLDAQSRRAIRRYQGDRNLPVTGYLNQPTVVQLLADSVRQVLQ